MRPLTEPDFSHDVGLVIRDGEPVPALARVAAIANKVDLSAAMERQIAASRAATKPA